MYEKIKKMAIAISIIVLFAFYFTGCTTTRAGTDNSVLEHQARITELEARVGAYEERLGQYSNLVGQYDELAKSTSERITTIRGRADRITDTLDRLEYLITEYEREVQRIIDENNRLGREIERLTKIEQDFMDYLRNLDSAKNSSVDIGNNPTN